jgi:hypothetical protein
MYKIQECVVVLCTFLFLAVAAVDCGAAQPPRSWSCACWNWPRPTACARWRGPAVARCAGLVCLLACWCWEPAAWDRGVRVADCTHWELTSRLRGARTGRGEDRGALVAACWEPGTVVLAAGSGEPGRRTTHLRALRCWGLGRWEPGRSWTGAWRTTPSAVGPSAAWELS